MVLQRTDSEFHIHRLISTPMDGVGERVRARLAREAWNWAGQGGSTARAVCEPFVRGVLQEEGVVATDEALEAFTAGFCERVTECKKSMAEIRRSEETRQALNRAWLRSLK